jgi:putative tricarboxylic transport membrane protein
LLKGLIAGLFGLLLGTVGVDVMTGFARYHFGIPALLGGVPLIPALIGLFALSEVMMMSESARRMAEPARIKGWGIKLALSDIIGSKINLIRSSIIGSWIGILPGAGADIASWVSYSEAKRFSKQSAKFGKGAIDGVIASETANNAATGGTLVPMLALGIPGGPVAAVLLGALLIQGLRPGRELFTVHAEMTYTFMVGFIVANILMGILGLLIMPRLAFITRAPVSVVAPIIVALCVVGSFAIANHMYDVWLMLLFGVLGYFMRKAEFPPAAVILGLVLGPIAELGLRQSLVLGGEGLALASYFFGRPISVVLMALITGSVLLPFILRKKVGPSN